MALKDLLVYVDESENSLIRLRLAVDLAIRHGSRLTALHVREWSRAQLDLRKAAELGLVSAEGLHDLDRRIEASIDAAAERLRSTLAALTRDHDVEAELRSVEGEASIVVPQCARYADLCIVGPRPARGCLSQLHFLRAAAVRDRTADFVRPVGIIRELLAAILSWPGIRAVRRPDRSTMPCRCSSVPNERRS